MMAEAIVPAGCAWEDPVAYAAIRGRGRSGLAWELLRRDPGYHLACAGLLGQENKIADSAFVARWGLHFR